MFTGIIEELGRVLEIDVDRPQNGLIIEALAVLEDARPGDSIAVNGACLTVTTCTDAQFAVGIMSETLRRTNLGDLTPGDKVNLERPLQPHSRLGGHFVQGHVDGLGLVRSTEPDGTALDVWIEAQPDILRYVVEKGFIAIDGVSLTVTKVDDTGFGVALIPFTQENVAPRLFTPGREVNLEVDVLAKYVEKLLIH